MSANVLDAIVNESTVPEGIWWERTKDSTNKVSLAKRITGDETVEEIIKLLGWEWTPCLQRLYNKSTQQEVDAFEIFRNDTDESLGLILAQKCSLPPSPRELVEWMDAAKNKLSAKWSTAGMTTTSKLWAQIAVDQSVDLGDGDIVENRLLMAYDYKGRSGKVKVCTTNVVCENTLCMSLSEKHNGRVDYDFSSLDDAAIVKLGKKLGIARTKFDETISKYRSLQTKQVDLENSAEISTFAYILDTPGLLDRIVSNQEEQQQIVSDLLNADSKTMRNRTMEMGRKGKDVLVSIVAGLGQDLEARKDNWYGAFQGVTYWADHVAGRNESSRLDSAYFGTNSELKEQALECAMIMSGVR